MVWLTITPVLTASKFVARFGVGTTRNASSERGINGDEMTKLSLIYRRVSER